MPLLTYQLVNSSADKASLRSTTSAVDFEIECSLFHLWNPPSIHDVDVLMSPSVSVELLSSSSSTFSQKNWKKQQHQPAEAYRRFLVSFFIIHQPVPRSNKAPFSITWSADYWTRTQPCLLWPGLAWLILVSNLQSSDSHLNSSTHHHHQNHGWLIATAILNKMPISSAILNCPLSATLSPLSALLSHGLEISTRIVSSSSSRRPTKNNNNNI